MPDVISRDFDARARAPTILTPPDEHSESKSRHGAPRSPVAGSLSPGRERRSSVASKLSVGTGEGMTFRKRSRTNTVMTFHEPETGPPGIDFQPGAEPGVDTSAEDEKIPAHLLNLHTECDINIIDFSDTDIVPVQANNLSLESALETPRSEDLPCRWISVNGLSWDVIKQLGNKYKLHQLAVEDLINTHTRTKVDWYADQAFIVLTLQKVVKLHQHKGSSSKCACGGMTQAESYEVDEKFEARSRSHRRKWWKRWLRSLGVKRKPEVLPRYLDRDHDGKMDEFITAHTSMADDAPVKPIRTLHRYESARIPEHSAWMERHSALTKDDLAVSVEQVSIFLLSDNSVISFFEHSAEDVEEPLMKRLGDQETMLRRSCDASLLTQAIVDTIVDLATPVRDAYNRARKELQIDAMTKPNIKTSRALHIFGEEVDMLQNLIKPIVHLVNSLRDHNIDFPAPGTLDSTPTVETSRPLTTRKMSEFRKVAIRKADLATSVAISPLAHTYFGDVLDHCITLISALEQMDASANNISTLIFNTVGATTNNFMMILAVVTVFFAPLTFISGYFGMNFASGGGLAHPFGFFWIVAVPSLVGFMLLVFATMLWENIGDFWTKRGIKANFHSPLRRPHVRPNSRSAH